MISKFYYSTIRNFTTDDGKTFDVFKPGVYRSKGKNIVVEREAFQADLPMTVYEKPRNWVIRQAKGRETSYNFFEIYEGGSQDWRQSYGWFKIVETNGQVVSDLETCWGSQHQVILALPEKDGYAIIEGNPGAGFKSRNPQPDFKIKLLADGSEIPMQASDIEI